MQSMRPTTVRWRILLCVTFMTVLTYVDRLNLSIAGQRIQRDFAFDQHTMGWLLSAFLLGYALMQVPGGWAGDRFGARNVLFAALLWWSAFTALTALAPNLPLARWLSVAWSFAIIRFLVGVGEAASLPSMNRIVAAWTGSTHRGIGASFAILGIGAGGTITPVFIAWIMQRWGWRSAFFIAGAIGIAYALFWRSYVTDSAEQHPGVNQAELQLISRDRAQKAAVKPKGTPWRKILASPSVWGLVLGYLCQGFPIYFFHTWFFIYLVNIRGLSISQSSLFGSMPYIAIACLAPLGGIYSDFLVKRVGKRLARPMAIGTGMLVSAALLWSGSNAANNLIAILLLAGGAGFNMFASVTFWAVCMDLSVEFTGSISGLMNTFGNLGGWLSPIVTAYVATRFGWIRALLCVSLVTLGSALFALLIRADRCLDESSVALAPGDSQLVEGPLKESGRS